MLRQNKQTSPKILQIETGHIARTPKRKTFEVDLIDYKVYDQVPRFWRAIEEWLALDLYLAYKAKAKAKDYDIIWAGSEKVGIPLSFLGLKKPMVVIAHHPESRWKAKFLRLSGIASKWAGIGYISKESKKFFTEYLKISTNSLFQYYSANYLNKVDLANSQTLEGIVCTGVAKRDYKTLLTALSKLNGYNTKLFVSSKFGDILKSSLPTKFPEWVQFPGFVTEEELIRSYQASRFVIVPLEETTHNGAGTSSVLEAGACGKAVIATRTGGMESFVKDGVTGILVPPNDPKAMCKAIQKLWLQPDLAKKMGMANRQFIESDFDPDIVDTKIKKFLHSL